MLAQVEITVWTIHKIPLFLIVVFVITPILYWRIRKVVIDAKNSGVEEMREILNEMREFKENHKP